MGEFLDFSLIWFSQNTNLIGKLCENSTAALQIIHRQKILNQRKIRRARNKRHILFVLSRIIGFRSSPRCWQLDRSSRFWELDCQLHGDDIFKNNFRMSSQVFKELCGFLENMRKFDTNFRKAIPYEKRVAIALYALGSSAEYRSIGNLFGVSKTTVCRILVEFCHEVYKQLKPIYLNYFPLSRETIEESLQGFEKYGLPQCLGAIDGSHIEVHPHLDEAVDYYNYKEWYSTVLFAMVDYRCRFLYVNVGHSGNCNDSQIYENSKLKKHLSECQLLASYSKNISGTSVPVYVAGDSAFQFAPNLMKPYPFHAENNEQRKVFNYMLSKNRSVVENAFGHLKARFRRIGKGLDNKMKNVNIIILACCVLHNFLNIKNDKMNQKWVAEFDEYEKSIQYPKHENTLVDLCNDADQIRTAISLYALRGVPVNETPPSYDQEDLVHQRPAQTAGPRNLKFGT